MARYNNNTIKIDKSGKRVYTPSIYPNIPLSNFDLYVMSEAGDRLDSLAFQYFGDSTLWWVLASANNIHTAPIGLKEGTILRIPAEYIGALNQL